MLVGIQKVSEEGSDDFDKIDDVLTAKAESCKKAFLGGNKPYGTYCIKGQHVDKAHHPFGRDAENDDIKHHQSCDPPKHILNNCDFTKKSVPSIYDPVFYSVQNGSFRQEGMSSRLSSICHNSYTTNSVESKHILKECNQTLRIMS